MLEAYAFPRPPPPTLSLSPPTPIPAPSPATACWPLIDRLVAAGALGSALRRCSPAPVERRQVQRLVALLQAAYLELGACCLGGVMGEGSTGEDTLPVSGLAKQVRCGKREW